AAFREGQPGVVEQSGLTSRGSGSEQVRVPHRPESENRSGSSQAGARGVAAGGIETGGAAGEQVRRTGRAGGRTGPTQAGQARGPSTVRRGQQAAASVDRSNEGPRSVSRSGPSRSAGGPSRSGSERQPGVREWCRVRAGRVRAGQCPHRSGVRTGQLVAGGARGVPRMNRLGAAGTSSATGRAGGRTGPTQAGQARVRAGTRVRAVSGSVKEQVEREGQVETGQRGVGAGQGPEQGRGSEQVRVRTGREFRKRSGSSQAGPRGVPRYEPAGEAGGTSSGGTAGLVAYRAHAGRAGEGPSRSAGPTRRGRRVSEQVNEGPRRSAEGPSRSPGVRAGQGPSRFSRGSEQVRVRAGRGPSRSGSAQVRSPNRSGSSQAGPAAVPRYETAGAAGNKFGDRPGWWPYRASQAARSGRRRGSGRSGECPSRSNEGPRRSPRVRAGQPGSEAGQRPEKVSRESEQGQGPSKVGSEQVQGPHRSGVRTVRTVAGGPRVPRYEPAGAAGREQVRRDRPAGGRTGHAGRAGGRVRPPPPPAGSGRAPQAGKGECPSRSTRVRKVSRGFRAGQGSRQVGVRAGQGPHRSGVRNKGQVGRSGGPRGAAVEKPWRGAGRGTSRRPAGLCPYRAHAGRAGRGSEQVAGSGIECPSRSNEGPRRSAEGPSRSAGGPSRSGSEQVSRGPSRSGSEAGRGPSRSGSAQVRRSEQSGSSQAGPAGCRGYENRGGAAGKPSRRPAGLVAVRAHAGRAGEGRAGQRGSTSGQASVRAGQTRVREGQAEGRAGQPGVRAGQGPSRSAGGPSRSGSEQVGVRAGQWSAQVRSPNSQARRRRGPRGAAV
ncbi:collagen alpha-1(I) chain-like, partial [Vigna umbellata]|uniref:collagen alpha-1(I) chain-like n=1 Tax=Vigna umbellata TaxID=87088 RepID=UPI001F5EEA66